jgi:hypothetical protein
MGSTTGTPQRTVVGHSTGDKVLLFGGLPLLGLVLGFFLPRIADWAAGRHWVPSQGVLKVIAAWDGWWRGWRHLPGPAGQGGRSAGPRRVGSQGAGLGWG